MKNKAKLSARAVTTRNRGMRDYDESKYAPINEDTFQANADMIDGHSGKKTIDTEYENYGDNTVNAPRSGKNDQGPTPYDTYRP